MGGTIRIFTGGSTFKSFPFDCSFAAVSFDQLVPLTGLCRLPIGFCWPPRPGSSSTTAVCHFMKVMLISSMSLPSRNSHCCPSRPSFTLQARAPLTHSSATLVLGFASPTRLRCRHQSFLRKRLLAYVPSWIIPSTTYPLLLWLENLCDQLSECRWHWSLSSRCSPSLWSLSMSQFLLLKLHLDRSRTEESGFWRSHYFLLSLTCLSHSWASVQPSLTGYLHHTYQRPLFSSFLDAPVFDLDSDVFPDLSGGSTTILASTEGPASVHNNVERVSTAASSYSMEERLIDTMAFSRHVSSFPAGPSRVCITSSQPEVPLLQVGSFSEASSVPTLHVSIVFCPAGFSRNSSPAGPTITSNSTTSAKLASAFRGLLRYFANNALSRRQSLPNWTTSIFNVRV